MKREAWRHNVIDTTAKNIMLTHVAWHVCCRGSFIPTRAKLMMMMMDTPMRMQIENSDWSCLHVCHCTDTTDVCLLAPKTIFTGFCSLTVFWFVPRLRRQCAVGHRNESRLRPRA